ncbi:DUF485 domain-containing protein [Corynebacterium sphenisci]|uniref:DUF485 domain-containing protein n=1 Tax=Corynebacterium sphenisci TaxID=191493 RepID=UPI0026E0FB98|nr:DUF485 domain-containing protein [Corynebacterium sphenisci]MDO5731911.1 DUF485 domain-containing protein [Corynebacterium sphenisci]
MQGTEEFQHLRSTFRGFAIPLTVAGLVWYLAYILVAIFAPDLMTIELFRNVNLGFLLGFLQFVTTFAITAWYISFGNKNLTEKQTVIREAMETGQIAQKMKEGK